MLYKIRCKCNPIHLLNDALPGPIVKVRVTRDALAAHRYTFVPSRCRTSQYRRIFVHQVCPFGSILLTPCSMVWDWRVSRGGPMFFYWPKLLYPYYSLLLFFPFPSSCIRLVFWGWGLRTDSGYITLSAFYCRLLLIIMIIIRQYYTILSI